jgi:transposase
MELMHRRCCGLDVHKETVVACLRLVCDGQVTTEVRTFRTTTAELLRLSKWLTGNGCTHVAMEATGVYWKPVWHILDDGEFALLLANAAHVKNVPGRKTDVNDATARRPSRARRAVAAQVALRRKRARSLPA